MKISSFAVGPFSANCYLVIDEDAGQAVLIDPGDEGDRLVAAIQKSGVELAAIWLTHAHLDHVGGIAEVRRHWTVPIALHPADEPLYTNAAKQATAYGLPFDSPPRFDQPLHGGDDLNLGAYTFQVMHAPGHAPGHVVFHGHGVAFVGDCLFAGSVGRTDLPFSNGADLAASLERIAALPGGTRVFPGHGPETTIAVEQETNPFLNGAMRPVRR